jgi:PAS domain S-box-containing protein
MRESQNNSSTPAKSLLSKLPTTKKLQLIVAVFVCIVFAVLGLVFAGSQITSAARAYVAGEGLWSKAQKKATIELLEYAYKHDEKDYQEFQDSLSVPLGDRKARLEMEKPVPDKDVVFAGFREGKIAEADIPGMMRLFRRFRRTELIDRAAAIWAKGDEYVDEMRQEGAELHRLIGAKQASEQQIAAVARRVEATDERLTPLENEFSSLLSAGARSIDKAFHAGLPLAACLLLALGMAVSLIVVREVDSSEAVRSRAEAATRESEERYRELLQNANDIVYVHDLTGHFVSWNRKGEELLGYKMSESQGLHIRDVVAPEDLPIAEEMTSRKLTGRNFPPYSLRLVAKDGRRCEVEVSSRLLYVRGKAIGVQGIARDLSERRRLEAELLQAQKMEAVGRLAGGIAHDFNNILMIVRGYAESLQDRLHPEDPLTEHADQIIKAANRAAELTQRLLGFSRKQVFEPRVVELNSIVAETVNMLPRLLGADIELLANLDPNAGNVNADPVQLEQVLINLAVNSRDAMPNGGRLIISTGCRELEQGDNDNQILVPGRYAEILVQDSGCGMSAETRRHIFEPFFTTKDKDKGTGLGLSTVYGIVRKSGGGIYVYSEVGIGTAMRIYLPQVASAIEPRAPEVRVERREAARGGTVLIAEDQPSLRSLVAETMRAEGYQVLEASNGEEAVEMANRHRGPIDFLLTDVIMPKLRGPEVAARLRARYPELKVIFMSGYAESALVEDGVLEKNTVLLQKPFSLKKVLEAVQQLEVTTGR